MKVYNENVAYDLSLFEPKKPKFKKIETPKQEVVISKKTSPVKVVAVAFCIVSILSVLLYSRVVLTELSDNINTQTKTLTALKSENVRMRVELESGSAIGNIDELAREMGLGKIEQYQIEYIDVNNTDKITVTKVENKGIIEKLIDSINKYFK